MPDNREEVVLHDLGCGCYLCREFFVEIGYELPDCECDSCRLDACVEVR